MAELNSRPIQHNFPFYPSSLRGAELELLAYGKSSLVYTIDTSRILKQYHDDANDFIVECSVFARLGSYMNIANFVGVVNSKTNDGEAIVVERGEELRAKLKQPNAKDITLAEKLGWIKDAAEGMRHCHQNGIIHADIGCSNMILVDGRVKLIDFEGCSIDGQECSGGYQWNTYRASTPRISLKTDIFAFGCAIYEIVTGLGPYEELVTVGDYRRERVMELYAEDKYPVLTELPLGEIIQGCWNGSFDSSSALIKALDTASNTLTDHGTTSRTAVPPWSGFANFLSLFSARLLSWQRWLFSLFRNIRGVFPSRMRG